MQFNVQTFYVFSSIKFSNLLCPLIFEHENNLDSSGKAAGMKPTTTIMPKYGFPEPPRGHLPTTREKTKVTLRIYVFIQRLLNISGEGGHKAV